MPFCLYVDIEARRANLCQVKEGKEIARTASPWWAKWSPDGSRFIVITKVNDCRSTYLYDLRDDSVTKIADFARPAGWLK